MGIKRAKHYYCFNCKISYTVGATCKFCNTLPTPIYIIGLRKT